MKLDVYPGDLCVASRGLSIWELCSPGSVQGIILHGHCMINVFKEGNVCTCIARLDYERHVAMYVLTEKGNVGWIYAVLAEAVRVKRA